MYNRLICFVYTQIKMYDVLNVLIHLHQSYVPTKENICACLLTTSQYLLNIDYT